MPASRQTSRTVWPSCAVSLRPSISISKTAEACRRCGDWVVSRRSAASSGDSLGGWWTICGSVSVMRPQHQRCGWVGRHRRGIRRARRGHRIQGRSIASPTAAGCRRRRSVIGGSSGFVCGPRLVCTCRAREQYAQAHARAQNTTARIRDRRHGGLRPHAPWSGPAAASVFIISPVGLRAFLLNAFLLPSFRTIPTSFTDIRFPRLRSPRCSRVQTPGSSTC